MKYIPAKMDEMCNHENCPPQRRSVFRIDKPSHLVRLCECGAKAGCPAACGYQRDLPCSCQRRIKGDYCPRCGAQKLVRDWSQSYISSSIVLVCEHCRHGFLDTASGRWTIRKFPGTNFRKDRPIIEIINPHHMGEWRRQQRTGE